MNKTKIEWCDSSWNPVTGCLHKCEYCYARKIANRFGTIDKQIESAAEEGIGLDSTYFSNPEYFPTYNEPIRDENGKIEPYPDNFYPAFHRYRLGEPARKTKPQTIFVCSMADLFGGWVPDEWIEQVFAACDKAPQHRFLFLTKNPVRYEMLHQKGILRKRDNMWYGYSVTNRFYDYWHDFQYNVFASIEPILSPLNAPPAKWIIIGAETGNRKDKVTPKKGWIDDICRIADEAELPVFMKDSLTDIVGEENMRREFPWSTD